MQPIKALRSTKKTSNSHKPNGVRKRKPPVAVPSVLDITLATQGLLSSNVLDVGAVCDIMIREIAENGMKLKDLKYFKIGRTHCDASRRKGQVSSFTSHSYNKLLKEGKALHLKLAEFPFAGITEVERIRLLGLETLLIDHIKQVDGISDIVDSKKGGKVKNDGARLELYCFVSRQRPAEDKVEFCDFEDHMSDTTAARECFDDDDFPPFQQCTACGKKLCGICLAEPKFAWIHAGDCVICENA